MIGNFPSSNWPNKIIGQFYIQTATDPFHNLKVDLDLRFLNQIIMEMHSFLIKKRDVDFNTMAHIVNFWTKG